MAIPGAVTDPARIRGEDISYLSGGTSIRAYLARPTEGGRHPGILVIHEAFGLNDHIRDIANRFAQRGYIALAPDLYTRHGAPDPQVPNSIMATMFGLSDPEAVQDMEAGAARIRSEAGSNGRVGVMGFCSGGRHTLLLAFSSPVVDAAVSCWGGFIRRATPDEVTTASRPTPIIDLAPDLHCPLLVAIGREDQNPSPEDAAELKRSLEGVHLTFRT
ncbi:MAG: dienelactone hydrolase family protein [Clostridia bacterium]